MKEAAEGAYPILRSGGVENAWSVGPVSLAPRSSQERAGVLAELHAQRVQKRYELDASPIQDARGVLPKLKEALQVWEQQEAAKAFVDEHRTTRGESPEITDQRRQAMIDSALLRLGPKPFNKRARETIGGLLQIDTEEQANLTALHAILSLLFITLSQVPEGTYTVEHHKRLATTLQHMDVQQLTKTLEEQHHVMQGLLRRAYYGTIDMKLPTGIDITPHLDSFRIEEQAYFKKYKVDGEATKDDENNLVHRFIAQYDALGLTEEEVVRILGGKIVVEDGKSKHVFGRYSPARKLARLEAKREALFSWWGEKMTEGSAFAYQEWLAATELAQVEEKAFQVLAKIGRDADKIRDRKNERNRRDEHIAAKQGKIAGVLQEENGFDLLLAEWTPENAAEKTRLLNAIEKVAHDNRLPDWLLHRRMQEEGVRGFLARRNIQPSLSHTELAQIVTNCQEVASHLPETELLSLLGVELTDNGYTITNLQGFAAKSARMNAQLDAGRRELQRVIVAGTSRVDWYGIATQILKAEEQLHELQRKFGALVQAPASRRSVYLFSGPLRPVVATLL